MALSLNAVLAPQKSVVRREYDEGSAPFTKPEQNPIKATHHVVDRPQRPELSPSDALYRVQVRRCVTDPRWFVAPIPLLVCGIRTPLGHGGVRVLARGGSRKVGSIGGDEHEPRILVARLVEPSKEANRPIGDKVRRIGAGPPDATIDIDSGVEVARMALHHRPPIEVQRVALDREAVQELPNEGGRVSRVIEVTLHGQPLVESPTAAVRVDAVIVRVQARHHRRPRRAT